MVTRTTVYAVTYGEYSDWGVGPLFPTRELAEAYGRADRVEEFDLWDAVPHKLPWTQISYFDPPLPSQDGDSKPSVSRWMKDGDDADAARWPSIGPTVREHEHKTVSGVVRYSLTVEGPDGAAVRKLFNERRAEHEAQS